MRQTRLFILLILSAFFMLSLESCKRGISVDEINAMQNGAQRDSATLYYFTGLQKGNLLIVTDNFYINTQAKSEFKGKKEIRPGDDYEYPVDEYRGAQIFAGDTLLVVGGYKHQVFDNAKKTSATKYRGFVQIERISNGKVNATGWVVGQHDLCKLKAPKTPEWWLYVFNVASADLIASTIIVSLFFVILTLIWQLVYKLVIKFFVKSEVFWKRASIATQYIFLISSAALAILLFLIQLNDALTISLRFNVNFFSHWSEYPLFLKFVPFVLGIWLISGIGMLWEMIAKFGTWWLVIYYPGKVALGMLVVGLVMVAGWLIYFIIPGVIALLAIMMMGKTDEMTGGSLSRESSMPTMTFKDADGGQHVSGVDRDAANKRIAERKANQ